MCLSRGKLAIIHNLPDGGGKKLLKWTIEELSRRNWRITIFGPVEEDKTPFSLRSLVMRNKNVSLISQPWMKAYSGKFWRFMPYVKQILIPKYREIALVVNEGNYDAILVYSDWMVMVPPIFKWLELKNIYMAFELKREFYEKTFWPGSRIAEMKEKIWRYLTHELKHMSLQNARLAGKIFTISRFSAKKLKSVYRKSKVYWCYPGLGNREYDNLVFNGRDSRENYFITIGSLCYLKGHDRLINAISSLPSHIRYPLHIIANGKEHLPNIVRFAEDKNIRLKVYLNIPFSKLREKLIKAKLFLYAPRQEPLGLALLEALRFGIPSVVINEGGPGEIASELGLPTYSQQSLHKGIIRLMSKYTYYGKVFQQTSYQVGSKFSIKRYVDYLESLL